MRTLAVYHSKKNTKVMLDEIAKTYDVTLVKANEIEKVDAKDYDLILFASGIWAGQFHPSVRRAVKKLVTINTKVFFLYSYAFKRDAYIRKVKKLALKNGATYMGEYGAKGADPEGFCKVFEVLEKYISE